MTIRVFIVEYHNGGAPDDDVHFILAAYTDLLSAVEDSKDKLEELRADTANAYRTSCYLTITVIESDCMSADEQAIRMTIQ